MCRLAGSNECFPYLLGDFVMCLAADRPQERWPDTGEARTSDSESAKRPRSRTFHL
jgi:hypothetical protein